MFLETEFVFDIPATGPGTIYRLRGQLGALVIWTDGFGESTIELHRIADHELDFDPAIEELTQGCCEYLHSTGQCEFLGNGKWCMFQTLPNDMLLISGTDNDMRDIMAGIYNELPR